VASTSVGDAHWTIGADLSQLSAGLAAGLSQVSAATNKIIGLGAGVATSFVAVGAAAVVGTALIVGGLVSAVKESARFEESFVGVRKTVTASEAEFAAIAEGLEIMAIRTGTGANELAKIAEIAGQLGISKDYILTFASAVNDLAVSSNVAGEAGALMLAQFMNITDTPQYKVSNLASAIVDLGNNSATTENDILTLGTRIAAAGKLSGMTEGDILGIAAALASVGVQAQMGGTAISRAIHAMNDDFLAGEEHMEKWAEVAGVTAKEFSDKWRKDPAQALAMFILGLQEMKEEGGSVTATIEGLGLKGVRLADVLGRATLTADLFEGSIQRGNDAFRDNTALQEEAQKFYSTTNSLLRQCKEAWNAVKREMGDNFLPVLKRILLDVKDWLVQLDAWIEKNSGLFSSLVDIFDLFYTTGLPVLEAAGWALGQMIVLVDFLTTSFSLLWGQMGIGWDRLMQFFGLGEGIPWITEPMLPPGTAQHGGVHSGWTIVGEQGPELINLGQSSRIYPAQETQSMLGASSGTSVEIGTMNLTVNDAAGQDPRDIAREFFEQFGDVVSATGQGAPVFA
jgi:TP901 family phage tail tape measure protein